MQQQNHRRTPKGEPVEISCSRDFLLAPHHARVAFFWIIIATRESFFGKRQLDANTFFSKTRVQIKFMFDIILKKYLLLIIIIITNYYYYYYKFSLTG